MMNLFENLQLMKESDASDHIYNGKSYWSVNDMNSLYKETALKINKINKNDKMKLFPELKKYDHKMSFMPKYSKGLLSPYGYPTSINDIIASPEHGTFLDEDELWDVIEDLIKINNYLDGIDINKLPKYEPPKRHYNTNGNTKESLIDYYNSDRYYPGLKQLIADSSLEVISTDRQLATKTLVLYLDKLDKSLALFSTGYLRMYNGKGTKYRSTNIKFNVDFNYIKSIINKNV